MSACRCTDTEVCFPCREREAHEAVGRHSVHGIPLQQFYSPVYSAPRVSPPPAEAPDVEPATDEQIAEFERLARQGVIPEDVLPLVARVRQAEAERDAYRDAWITTKRTAGKERAEVARLREQVAAMQAADVGAFW